MIYHLTRREYQVLEILSDGNTNKKISQKLKISVRTVESILYSIFKKVNCGNRLELATKYNSNPDYFKVKILHKNKKHNEIITLYKRGDLDINQIASRLNTTYAYVKDIINGFTDEIQT